MLLDFEKRVVKREKPEGVKYHGLVDEPVAPYFCYIKAIRMMQLCMACHEYGRQISDRVRAQLAAEYQPERAIDY